MSQMGNYVETIRNQALKVTSSPVQIGQVITLNPLSVQYQGLDLSIENGDSIYVNGLLLDENINLDVSSMDSTQTIDPALWQGNDSPTSSIKISGTQKQFITNLYNWIRAVHDRYILHIGDYVAIQKLGNNTYLILEKVQRID